MAELACGRSRLALLVDAQPTGTAEPDAQRAAAPPVFLSYSRRDYYFAESLAHELARAASRSGST